VLAAVVGGNLQGVEAAYLAQKAGWDVVVIDRKPHVPASGLCEHFIQKDITAPENLNSALKGTDIVIPAMENAHALKCLDSWTQTNGIPFAFDLDAYSISCSKLTSDRLFARIGIPAPLPWPDCGFPVLAKPNAGSGSKGVTIVNDVRELEAYSTKADEGWVLQEYVQGPSYSIEVLGRTGRYLTPQVTDLEMDETYDCKRVLAPTDLAEPHIGEFEMIAVTLAEAVNLRGLMDVEVILHDNRLMVLEIDARLPSQTPTTVYWSTGLNMVKMLGDLFLNETEVNTTCKRPAKGVVYEHIRVTPDTLQVAGEHIMSATDPLHIEVDFFGADEAITNYAAGRNEWVATVIVCDESRAAAWAKRNSVISEIQKRFKLKAYHDSAPSGVKIDSSTN